MLRPSRRHRARARSRAPRLGIHDRSATPASARQSLQQRRPSFRAGVELIYVNVVVRDDKGNIVRNLKPADFTLLEDDKAQTISAFDFEEVPSEALPTDPTGRARAADIEGRGAEAIRG